MIDRETIVPALNRPVVSNPSSVQRFLDAVFSTLQVREGRAGSELDQNVTKRDLYEAGLTQILVNGTYVPYTGTNTTGMVPASSGGSPNLTTPPTPTGLTANGTIGVILLSWTDPRSLYSNHGLTEVWRSNSNDIGTAVMIGTSDSRFYADSVGQNGATKYYWIRFVSDAGKEGPYNATSGVSASTSSSPGWILTDLTGQIQETHLYSTLNDRIDLIDGASGLAGSVNARILTETNARIAAITAEATTRAADIAAEAAARGTAITNEQTLRETADTALASSISLLTASSSGSFDPAVIWYYDTTVEGWTSTGATQSWNAGWIEQDATGSDPQLTSPSGLSILGSQYNVVMARIKRLAGTESSWDGTVTYVTGGHSFSGSYKKTVSVPSPFDVGDIAVVEWDMSDLTAGGTDWVDSTITQIRLELGADTTDTIAIDWIGVGRKAPGASVAGLMTEQAARISGDAAEVTARETLASQITGFTDPTGKTLSDLTTGLIYSEKALRTSGDASNASAITALDTRLTSAEGVNTSQASSITSLNSSVSTINGTLTSHSSSLTSLDSRITSAEGVNTSQATSITSLNSSVSTINGTLTSQSSSITSLTSRMTSAESSISSQATSISSLNTSVSTINGTLTAQAVTNSTLSASIASNTSAISTEASTRATADGALNAEYTLKLDVNGTVAGFGLAVVGGSSGPATSDFYVSASKFSVGPPSPKWSSGLGTSAGVTYVRPLISNGFIYIATTNGVTGSTQPSWPTTVGGTVVDGTVTWRCVNAIPFIIGTVNSVPAVVIDTAYIGDATITNAKIGSIAAEKILAGVINAFLTIESPRINAGIIVGANIRTSTLDVGARTKMDGAGFHGYDSGGTRKTFIDASTGKISAIDAEFTGNGIFYGTIYASAGTFAGALSSATGTFSGSLNAATGTFAGSLSAATGTFSGTLSGANGTFTGALSGATGTFAGSLSAATGTFSGALSSVSGTFTGTVNAGAVIGGTIDGTTITGGLIRTSSGSKRIELNNTNNEAYFYGDAGGGSERLASIGINSLGGSDFAIGVFGSVTAGNNKYGVYAASNSSIAMFGKSISETAVYGLSNSGGGVHGTTNTGIGVRGSSNTNIGVYGFSGSNTAIYGTSTGGYGVNGVSTNSYGGVFSGGKGALQLVDTGLNTGAGYGVLTVFNNALWLCLGDGAWNRIAFA